MSSYLFIYILLLFLYDVFEYECVCILIYYSSIHVIFYSGNVWYESVVELLYIDCTFSGCAVEKFISQHKNSIKSSHLFLINRQRKNHIQRFYTKYKCFFIV